MEPVLEQLRYPIGKFKGQESYTAEDLSAWISTIEALPLWFDHIIENLDAHQLDTPYRPGGWTMSQTIHHVADSHMNGFIRLKLALTEDKPVIKPYLEALWATTPEIQDIPVNVSITLLHSLHRRWASLLRNMKEDDWRRSYFHPEHQKEIPLWESTAMYAWHCRHHMEHLRALKDRMGW